MPDPEPIPAEEVARLRAVAIDHGARCGLRTEDLAQWRLECPPGLVLDLLADLDRLRSLLDAAIKIDQWGDAGRAHEYGCGNGRPCDACGFHDAIMAATGLR